MNRSATPFFSLVDRLRGEIPRPGVDRWEAAGVPQQNGAEMAVWAVLVSVLTMAGVMQGLDAAGLRMIAALGLAVPLAFVVLHLLIVIIGAAVGMVGFRSRGQMWIWISVYSAFACWVSVSHGWTQFAGWIWLVWIFFNLLAWIINEVWGALTADSR